jgi:hypothetical protein
MITRRTRDDKIQLRHPLGKKAVRIDQERYDILRASILRVLRSTGGGSHAELVRAVAADLNSRALAIEGSLEWYLESVKLDLEARGLIARDATRSPVQFRLKKKR